MNIAFACEDVQPNARQGGIASYTLTLSTQLAKRGHVVQVLGSSDRPVQSELQENVELVYLARHSKKWPGKIAPYFDRIRRAKQVARHFSRNDRFDIVECPLWNAEGLALGKGRFKHVCRAHTPHFVIDQILRSEGKRPAKVDLMIERLEARASRRADWVLGNSQSSLESIVKGLNLDANFASFCYHGIEIPKLPRKEERERQVLFWGRLEPRKGIDLLLGAIPSVLKEIPDAKFVLAGIDALDLGKNFWAGLSAGDRKRVVIAGAVSDDELEALMRKSMVACLPSRYESFGLVFVEAMARELPVVSLNTGIAKEIIGQTGAGLLTGPEPGEVSAALIEILSNEQKATELGANARLRATEHFSAEKMAECVEQTYQEILLG